MALYEQELRFVRPRTDGRDLKKMGLAPGPIYRDVLDAARDGWLDGTISSKEDEKTLVTHLVSEYLKQRKRRYQVRSGLFTVRNPLRD